MLAQGQPGLLPAAEDEEGVALHQPGQEVGSIGFETLVSLNGRTPHQ